MTILQKYKVIIMNIKEILETEKLSNIAWVSKIHAFSSLESTNKTAKVMVENGHGHGIIILANVQTAGRGRYGRRFHSQSGSGIYITFILETKHLSFKNPTLVTLFAAVAVCEAIKRTTKKDPKIKWLNDIFLDGAKIGGILTEMVAGGEKIILGIGVNFNIRQSDFPEELRQIAGSIYRDEKHSTTRGSLIAEIINQIFGDKMEKTILAQYRERLFILGQRVTVFEGQKSYGATAIDIDANGHLIIQKEEGDIVSLSSGEVSIQPTEDLARGVKT